MFRSLSGFKSVLSISKLLEAKVAISDTFHSCSYLTFSGFHESCLFSIVRQFHSSLPRKKDDKRSLISSAPVKDDGTSGERAINIDAIIQRVLETMLKEMPAATPIIFTTKIVIEMPFLLKNFSGTQYLQYSLYVVILSYNTLNTPASLTVI
ncbi:hypothetical protein J6590_013994 [Homalodisca vitripennis]|nr:hypothetical protein J6590_013994 [Homalodisca vitripennis]